MGCCRAVNAEAPLHGVEAFTNDVMSYGFDASWVADLISKWGEPVLVLVSEALRSGFSKELVLEVLEKFGPVILEILTSFFSQKKMAVVPTASAGLDPAFIESILKFVMDRYGDKVKDLIMDWVRKLLTA